MRAVPASGAGAIAHKAEILAGLDTLATELPLEELPDLVGELARAQALVALRFSRRSSSVPGGPEPALLTVEEVAAKLRISEANVYQRAKTDLRAATVDVGPGQLRFDARSIGRFIEARRRG